MDAKERIGRNEDRTMTDACATRSSSLRRRMLHGYEWNNYCGWFSTGTEADKRTVALGSLICWGQHPRRVPCCAHRGSCL